jgi:hypothetical protein
LAGGDVVWLVAGGIWRARDACMFYQQRSNACRALGPERG